MSRGRSAGVSPAGGWFWSAGFQPAGGLEARGPCAGGWSAGVSPAGGLEARVRAPVKAHKQHGASPCRGKP
jgi:hypothetical protein